MNDNLKHNWRTDPRFGNSPLILRLYVILRIKPDYIATRLNIDETTVLNWYEGKSDIPIDQMYVLYWLLKDSIHFLDADHKVQNDLVVKQNFENLLSETDKVIEEFHTKNIWNHGEIKVFDAIEKANNFILNEMEHPSREKIAEDEPEQKPIEPDFFRGITLN